MPYPPRFGTVAALAFAVSAAPAAATDSLSATSQVCGIGGCFDDSAPAGSTRGALRDTQVSHGWSHPSTGPDDDSWSFSANAATTVANAAQWGATVSAGGYYNGHSLNSSGGANAGTRVAAYDELTAWSTPSWNTTGLLRFSYRITGGAFVEVSSPAGSSPTQSGASAALTFECGNIHLGRGSSPCESPDLAPPSPGSNQLIGTIELGNGPVDRIVSFDLFVSANQTFGYALTSGTHAEVHQAGLLGITNGRAELDLMHTGRLVGVTLFDGAGNVVPDFVLTSSSGLDYQAAAALPEPASAGLFALGGLLVVTAAGRAGSRRARACAP